MVKVKDRDTGQLVPLSPRPAQVDFLETLARQAAAGQPLRVLVPKARKQGISTIVQALLYFLAAHNKLWTSLTVAHSKDAVGDIFGITHLIHNGLGYPGEAKAAEIVFPDLGSRYACRTALGAFTGSGGTVNALHVSEAAKMQQEAGGDTRALASLISAVPQLSPYTLIVIEATGQGPSGEFYTRCMQAAQGDTSYALCFFPWFHDPAYKITPPLKFKPTEQEYELQSRYGLSNGQLAWRRTMLVSEYAGREIEFAWDYPSTLEEAFLSPQGRMYPVFSRAKHVKTEAEAGLAGKSHDILLGIDFGAGPSPFTCVWIKHYPGRAPGFTVDPSCLNTIREHMAWSRDPKTGKPMDEADHTCDCVAYVVSTNRLTGHVHVYREMYEVNAAAAGHTHLSLAMEILRRSKGEHIVAAVCDRAEPLTINDLVAKGIPARAYTKLPGALGQGHVEQNAKRVLALMMGTEWFYDHGPSALETAQKKLATKAPDGRDREVKLTKREERAIEERRQMQEFMLTGGGEDEI